VTKRKKLVRALVLTIRGRRRRVIGVRLGRTNSDIGQRGPDILNLAALADWELELLADRKWGPFFAW
jgi:hypothetical protein